VRGEIGGKSGNPLNHIGKTTWEKPLGKNHLGKTTWEKPLGKNYWAKPFVKTSSVGNHQLVQFIEFTIGKLRLKKRQCRKKAEFQKDRSESQQNPRRKHQSSEDSYPSRKTIRLSRDHERSIIGENLYQKNIVTNRGK